MTDTTTADSFDPRTGFDDDGVMAPKEYDALLLASFGGPEGQADVIPFLRNVTAGRGVPDERLEEVATHYRANGGISPINDQNRALRASLEQELKHRGINLPVYWGNRNWDPYVPETLQQIYNDGHRRALTVTTSAYSCYSSCRQYREDLGVALRDTGLEGKLEVDKVRQYFDHPGFVQSFAEGMTEGLRSMLQTVEDTSKIHIFFATHSIPNADAAAAGPRPVAQELQRRTGAQPGETNGADAYSAQHLAVAELLMEMVEEAKGIDWSLVYQSRSGPPSVPWLEPDINDSMEEIVQQNDLDGVVVVPLGFVSDHMEVMWDLDTEAKETAEKLGVEFVRTPTPGTHQKFVSGLVDMVAERLAPLQERPERQGMSEFGPWYDVCRPNCCVKTMRDGTQKPTVAAVDSEVGVPHNG